MKTVQLTLSDEAASDVERLARERGFEDVGAYLESLVLADRRRTATERLEADALVGLESGPAVRATEAYWKEFHADVQRVLQERTPSSAPE